MILMPIPSRIHGTKSGKLLKEFRGHSSFVNDAIFNSDSSRVITGGSDGAIKVWDAKTCTCLQTVVLSEGVVAPSGTAGSAVIRILPHPRFVDQFVVISKSPWVHIINVKAQVVKAYSMVKQCFAGFIGGALSQRGDLLYLAGEDKAFHCLRLENGNAEGAALHLTDFELIGISCHPFANVFAAWDENGSLGLWK